MKFSPYEERPLVASLAVGLLTAATLLATNMYAIVMSLILATGFGFLFYFLRRQILAAHTARQYLARLEQLDHNDLAGDQFVSQLPRLPDQGPWRTTLQAIRDRLAELSQKIQAAEHSRTSAELRVRRVTSQNEKTSQILDGLSDPVLAIDQFDDLVLANPSAAELFDLTDCEAESQALRTVIECQQLIDLMLETRRHKTTSQRTGEITFVDHGGREQWFRVSCRGLAGDDQDSGDGGARGVVAVLRDISGQKVIQKRNAEFVSAVSHEMKTPLAGIKAYVELLADGDAEDDETREEFLEVINGQADRLQRLIDNLLNLARIEAGVVHVDKQSQSLNDLLEEAANLVQPAAERKQIQLATALSPMYLGVFADRDMLLQSAINLLSNAVKYTPEGGTVTLRSQMHSAGIVFEVEDTGVGLSPEDCKRVFDKFYRVKKDAQMAAGTGLGLPLARHIVEDVHQGQLTVESELGQGSTFRVTLRGEGS